MRIIFVKDRVKSWKCFIKVAKYIFKGSLSAENVMNDRLIFLSLLTEFNAILISFEALFEVMTLKKFGSLELPNNVLLKVFVSTHSSSNLNEIIIYSRRLDNWSNFHHSFQVIRYHKMTEDKKSSEAYWRFASWRVYYFHSFVFLSLSWMFNNFAVTWFKGFWVFADVRGLSDGALKVFFNRLFFMPPTNRIVGFASRLLNYFNSTICFFAITHLF